MASVVTNICNENSIRELPYSQGGTNNSGFSTNVPINSQSTFWATQTLTNGGIQGENATTVTEVNIVETNFVANASTSIAIPSNPKQAIITTAGTLTTITLPTTFSVGNHFCVQGQGSGLWKINAGTGRTIQFLGSATSSGGSISSSGQYDVVRLIGVVSNSTWSVVFASTSGFVIA